MTAEGNYLIRRPHGDDSAFGCPEMTTPSSSKIECVFSYHKETFIERVKALFPSGSTVFFLRLTYIFCSLSLRPFQMSLLSGSDADLWLNRLGFSGIPNLTVFTFSKW